LLLAAVITPASDEQVTSRNSNPADVIITFALSDSTFMAQQAKSLADQMNGEAKVVTAERKFYTQSYDAPGPSRTT
jgi:hypothetical protein